MPSAKFQFSHHGQPVEAELLYDFHEFSDAVIVIPNTACRELQENIIFIRRNHQWTTASALQEKFPVTILNIMEYIVETLELPTQNIS
jgi:hypothetical protein